MIKACYLPGAHLKITISLNGHIQSFGLKIVQELDDSIFRVFLAGVIPSQVEKNATSWGHFTGCGLCSI